MVVDSLFGPGEVASLVALTGYKWLLTTLAGVDFMVREIAHQREFGARLPVAR